MSYNKVIMVGNLVRDPELKILSNETVVMNCALAVTNRWTDKKTNEKRETVCFIDISAFGKPAESLADHFSKGNQILIEGELRQDTWESDGAKRSKHKIQVSRWAFTEKKDWGDKYDKDKDEGEDDEGEDDEGFF